MNDQKPKDEYEHYDKSFVPRPLIPEGHEHYLKMNPDERFAKCDCGFGGPVYPHNSIFKDGHLYKLDGTKVI